MDDYIKRDDALKIMKDAWMLHPSGDDAMQEAIDCISLLPAADVVERKIGIWELVSPEEENVYRCSKCGKRWLLNNGDPFDNEMNYCPRCGAKCLRGDDDV